jgi:hypothetical protein
MKRERKNNSPPERQQPTESATRTSEALAIFKSGRSSFPIDRRGSLEEPEIARARSRDRTDSERAMPAAIIE